MSISTAKGCNDTTGAAAAPFEHLSQLLQDDLGAVNTTIHERMESRHAPRIPEITAHLVNAGGKRLRPLLTLASARACETDNHHHIALAAAVEFIHTATLLHDDVVDESAQRRGRPTANLLWDNSSSVLVGDYLFARSFQLMVGTGNGQVLRILADAAAEIAEGEVLQLGMKRRLDCDETTYLRIIRGKTAALFAAATEAGAVIAGASDRVSRALRAYGNALGMLFQITDDLIDYLGDASVTGKNPGDDLRDGKLTLPVIKAVACAEVDELAFWRRVFVSGHCAEGDLEQALEFMTCCNALENTRVQAHSWVATAQEALDCLPESHIQQLLMRLPEQIIERIR